MQQSRHDTLPPARPPRESKPLPKAGTVTRFPSLGGARSELDQLRICHIDLAEIILAADNGKIYIPDLLVMPMIQRSYGVLDALIDAVDTSNIYAAGPLLRLQLDTLFRAHYLASAPNIDEVTDKLLNGEEFRKIKDAEGKRLTDARLKELAAEAHPWALPVYDKTSGWVHFSCDHVHAGFQLISESDFQLTVPLRADTIPESAWHEIYGAAIQATKEFFTYAYGWATRKGMPAGQTRTLT